MEAIYGNMKRTKGNPLTAQQLYEGHSLCVENAGALFEAGTHLLSSNPSVALGLLELGQEEVGKSFSFLAAFNHKPNEEEKWKTFWDEFRNHKLKAYRAHLYEIICPFRIHVDGEEDTISKRNSIHIEKEAALYVCFENESQRFVSPQTQVEIGETAIRGTTLLSLWQVAYYTKIGLDLPTDLDVDKLKIYKLFSDLPRRILVQNIYQQDWNGMLEEFAQRTPVHKSIANNLTTSLEYMKEDSRNMVARTRP